MKVFKRVKLFDDTVIDKSDFELNVTDFLLPGSMRYSTNVTQIGTDLAKKIGTLELTDKQIAVYISKKDNVLPILILIFICNNLRIPLLFEVSCSTASKSNTVKNFQFCIPIMDDELASNKDNDKYCKRVVAFMNKLKGSYIHDDSRVFS